MTKREFIEKYNLTKTKTKCIFYDGMARKERALYVDKYGKLFVFLNKDLCNIKAYTKEPYVEGMEILKGHITSAYSWYH